MRRDFLALFILWSLCFAVFSPSLSGDFLRDDQADIVSNPALGALRSWPRLLLDPSAQSAEPSIRSRKYRPVTTLSLAAGIAVGGYSPFWFHLLDIALHGLNACMVFLLMLHVLEKKGHPGTAAAWGAALLFAFHPVQVESVSYISAAHPNGLALMFCLGSFLLYVSRDRGRGFPPVLGASWALFAAALGAKESALFLPLAVAAYDLVFEEEGWSARLKRWVPYIILGAGFLVLRWAILSRTAHRGLWGGTLGAHMGYALHGLFHDICLALWPAGLSTCYSFQDGPGFTLETALIGGVLAALVWTAVRMMRRRRPEGFALAWSMAALLPVSNLVPISVLSADRFLHAPLVGLALLWGLLLDRLEGKRAAACAAALSVLMLPFTLEGQLRWQSQLALVLSSRSAAPHDPCPALILADQYLAWGMPAKAAELAAPVKDHRLLGKKARRILRRAGVSESD